MTPLAVRRWRGLNALLRDGVEGGSRAVERAHRRIARRPFSVLEAIPLVALPSRGVRLVHDAVVGGVYGLIRLGGRTVAAAVDLALGAAEPPAGGADQAGDSATIRPADAGRRSPCRRR